MFSLVETPKYKADIYPLDKIFAVGPKYRQISICKHYNLNICSLIKGIPFKYPAFAKTRTTMGFTQNLVVK